MNSEIRNRIEETRPAASPGHIRPDTAVLFVCLGNICRSPSAQGIFSHLAHEHGIGNRFRVDSAGTHHYHIGKPADSRAIAAAGKAGVDISGQRARQLDVDDFARFDHIFVMDQRNHDFVAKMCPAEYAHKVRPIGSVLNGTHLDGVPDPFHGTPEDFDKMIDLLFDVCTAVLEEFDRCRALAAASLSS